MLTRINKYLGHPSLSDNRDIVKEVSVADEDGLRAEVGTAVLRFIADVVLHNVTVAQRLGLGGSDLQFLTLLGTHGPLTPGRLATLTGLGTGTVTGVIDRLEKGGYVRRDRDGADRRKVLVSPVPESLARLAEFYSEHGDHMATVLAARDAEQLRTILDFLTDMNASPGRPPDADQV
jgi:DNA-binding MarR family transcriptional regulator